MDVNELIIVGVLCLYNSINLMIWKGKKDSDFRIMWYFLEYILFYFGCRFLVMAAAG